VAPHAAEIDRLNAYPAGFDFWRRAGEWGLHGAPTQSCVGLRLETPVACGLLCRSLACPLSITAIAMPLAGHRPVRLCLCPHAPAQPALLCFTLLDARSMPRPPRHAGITVPTEHGGLGLGYLQHCIAMEELSRASGSGATCTAWPGQGRAGESGGLPELRGAEPGIWVG